MNFSISEENLGLPGIFNIHRWVSEAFVDVPRTPPIPEPNLTHIKSRPNCPVKVFDRLFEDASRRSKVVQPQTKLRSRKKPKRNFSQTDTGPRDKKTRKKVFLKPRYIGRKGQAGNIEALITTLYSSRNDKKVSPILHSIQDIDDYIMRKKALRSPLLESKE